MDEDELIDTIAAYSAAQTAAFRTLVACLEDAQVLTRGDFAEALKRYTSAARSQSPKVATFLDELRRALLN